MKKYECVNLTIDGDVATVQLNRPEKRNCLSPTLHRNMVDALNEVAAAKCKVLVVTGSGDSFSAGMDLEQCFLEPFDDPQRFIEINTPCFEWLTHLKNFPGVTVAKVNGWAFGGGFEIASICDIVIAAEESVWGLSEINFGIFPGGGATWSYAHNMTRKQALFYALTGATLTGKQAVDLGLGDHGGAAEGPGRRGCQMGGQPDPEGSRGAAQDQRGLREVAGHELRRNPSTGKWPRCGNCPAKPTTTGSAPR